MEALRGTLFCAPKVSTSRNKLDDYFEASGVSASWSLRPQAIIGVAKFTHSVFCLSSMVKASSADKAKVATNKHDGAQSEDKVSDQTAS